MPTSAPEELSAARKVPSRKGSRRRKKGATRSIAQVLGVMTLVLAMVVGLGSMYYYRKLNGNLETSDAQQRLTNRPANAEVEGPHEPVDILIMGSDYRVDGSMGDQELSDTTILVHLSADRKRAYGISVPRDLIVERPDCTDTDGSVIPGASEAPWNAAFSYAGESCTMQQFEQMTGIKLEHQVVVRFPGFKNMVDALGGVRMCVPETIKDNYLDWTLEAGPNRLLKGDDALNYVRSRHGSGDGSDISRTRRQQAFIAAMISKAMSNGTLSSPTRVVSFLEAATKSLKTDMNINGLASLALDFKDIGLDDIQFLTIPNGYFGSDSQWFGKVAPSQPAADEVWKAIRRDKAIPDKFLAAMTSAAGGGKSTKATSEAGSTAPATPTPSPSDSPSSDPSDGASPSSKPSDSYVDPYADAEFNGLCG